MFSEFGTRQDLNRREFAFSNIFVLDFVSINVSAQFYQNIRTVQELGPVSFFFNFDLGKASTKLFEK